MTYGTTTEEGAFADIDVCMQRLEDIESHASGFTKKNPLRYLPQKSGERIAVIVGMLVMGGVLASITGGGPGSAVVIGLGLWFLAVLVARNLWTKGAAERYQLILLPASFLTTLTSRMDEAPDKTHGLTDRHRHPRPADSLCGFP